MDTDGILTEHQRRQIKFMDKMNDNEIRFGGWSTSYEVTCKDCSERKHYGAADNVRRFIEAHAGHRTWTEVLKNGVRG